jgi:8-oxo-dGTP pyrophosphatase MutT (NUDIX family)
MVERAAAIAYGGMWAFPGGRVEDDDADPDHPCDEVAQARRTAVREAVEEVGLALDHGELVPHSHWTGGAGHGRLYAAWYFLAPAPEGAEVVADGREAVGHRWIGPDEALACRDRGEIAVVAPTWMTLRSLVAARTVAEALALAARRAPIVYRSRMVEVGEARVVLWDGDAGYAAGDPAAPGLRHRLVMAATGWTFEQT